MPESQSRRLLLAPRLPILATVAVLHLAALWVLVTHFAEPAPAQRSSAAGITLVNVIPSTERLSMAVPAPELATIAVDHLLQPKFTLMEAEQGASVQGVSNPSITVPPRPDPAYLNENPPFPEGATRNKGLVQVVLVILVATTGAVVETSVHTSSGDKQLDTIAQTFVKAKWRFRPAQQGATLVSDWTTAVVTFV